MNATASRMTSAAWPMVRSERSESDGIANRLRSSTTGVVRGIGRVPARSLSVSRSPTADAAMNVAQVS